jgi:secernin
MCDIVVALPDSTSQRRVVFGKNSDRPAGECQVWFDSRDDANPSGRISCAFVEVPEAPVCLRTLGCRPYWSWGYETGANEAGVVGGNTAVYTRCFHLPENRRTLGLTGMELLRLGLQRGRTAAETVSVIATLLGEYGQWAPAIVGRNAPDGCYENAFLIADAREAWILETAGRRWAARRFTSGVHALSNQLTIRDTWTSASDDLAAHAVARGWWPRGGRALDFALAYSDHEHTARQVSHPRWRRSSQRLANDAPQIDVATVMAILRDHYEDTFLEGPTFDASLPDLLTVCMHDSPAGFTWGNTATSVIVEIDPDAPSTSPLWWCYQPPCTSVYVSTALDARLPEAVGRTGTAGLRAGSPVDVPPDGYRQESLWWRLFRVLNAVSLSPPSLRPFVRGLFDPIEKEYMNRVRSLTTAPDRTAALAALVNEQMREIDHAIARIERECER